MNEEIKNILAKEKELYIKEKGQNPIIEIDGKKYVDPDFMFFITGRFNDIRKEILKTIKD